MAIKMTNSDLANAVDLYQGGMSIQNVAARIGVGATSVRRSLIDAGVSIRSRSETMTRKIATGLWIPPTGSPRNKQILSEQAIEEAANAYQSGSTLEQVAQKHGVGTSTMVRYFKLRNIAVRNPQEQFAHKVENGKWQRPVRLAKPIPENLASEYLSGITLRELQSSLHICRKTLASQLKESGIEFDRRAMLIKREGEAGLRERMTAISHQARNAPDAVLKEGKKCAAKTRHAKRRAIGRYEHEFTLELQSLGFNVMQQFPVGTYNLDIALDEFHVAVEIECGSWHGASSMRCERIKHLLGAGWRIIVIRAGRNGHPVAFKAIAKKIAAYVNLASSDPSSVGQYGVLTRQAKPATRLPTYFNDWSRIPGF